jgi:membrane-bound serine protease (ClpP class)
MPVVMEKRSVLQATIVLFSCIALSHSALAQGSVYVMPLNANFIGPSTVDQVDKLISISEENDASAAVILLDTPGGRVDSMFEIMQLIYNSQVPVIVYVAPKGADAASAGAFITVSSHIAAMAPGTAIGAAEPVQSSSDPTGGTVQPAPNKTKSYIIGRMESTANLTGRPVEPLVSFITANLVLTPNEALEQGVIDFIAESEEELLSKIIDFPIHGSLGDGSRPNVTLAGAEIFYVELSISERFTNFMSDPTLSYILLLVGMYGLIFGLMSPGTYVPETLGAICIILALFGLGIVGANIVGILLLAMGMIFLLAEAATPTFGLFTVAAVICFIFGILFVPPRIGGDIIPTFYLPRQWYTTFTLTSLTLIAGFVVFFVIGMQYVLKGRNRPSKTGGDELMGMRGMTVGELDPKGQVRLRGELWTAASASSETIPGKTGVRVVGRKGLTLLVERTEGEEEGYTDPSFDR